MPVCIRCGCDADVDMPMSNSLDWIILMVGVENRVSEYVSATRVLWRERMGHCDKYVRNGEPGIRFGHFLGLCPRCQVSDEWLKNNGGVPRGQEGE